VRGRRRSVVEFEGEIVDVAVVPVLARFVGTDQGMGTPVEVGGGVAGGGAVAATDVGAGLTDPEVDPVVATGGQAVFAAGGRGRGVGDLVEVGAGIGHARTLQKCAGPRIG
jgi:hypothetical protein